MVFTGSEARPSRQPHLPPPLLKLGRQAMVCSVAEEAAHSVWSYREAVWMILKTPLPISLPEHLALPGPGITSTMFIMYSTFLVNEL